jgi:hypothetical protein
LKAWYKTVVFWLFPVLLLLNAITWFTGEFSQWRNEILEAPTPSAIAKLDSVEATLRAHESTKKPYVLIMGSSLMMTPALFADRQVFNQPSGDINAAYQSYDRFYVLERAINEAQANNRPVQVFSLAAPALMISEDTLLLESLLKQGPKPALIVLALAPRDFIDRTVAPPMQSPTAQLLIERLSPQLWNSKLTIEQNLEILGNRYCFVFRHRSKLRGLLAKTINSLPDSTNQISVTLQDSRLDAGKLSEDLEYYKKRYLPIDEKRWQHESTSLREFKQICSLHKIPLILLAMPITRPNLTLLPKSFLDLYRCQLQALSKQASRVKFIDLTQDPAFQQQDFTDSVHLRAVGAFKLSSALKQSIIDYLPTN